MVGISVEPLVVIEGLTPAAQNTCRPRRPTCPLSWSSVRKRLKACSITAQASPWLLQTLTRGPQNNLCLCLSFNSGIPILREGCSRIPTSGGSDCCVSVPSHSVEQHYFPEQFLKKK